MRDVFATIYETWFQKWDPDYELIFQVLYEEGGYVKLGLAFILIPLILWVLFYYVWKYPYGKIWHWLVWMLICLIIVFGASFGIANDAIFSSTDQSLNEALLDPTLNYYEYASSLPIEYALINSLLALGTGIVFSLVLKQWSKLQIHLPF